MDMAGADDPRADDPRAGSRSHSHRTDLDPRASTPGEPSIGGDAALPRGCPFLLAEDGGWRLDAPARDHRCSAFSPAAPLSPEKQSRLCLTPAHGTCATYLASMAAREARLGAVPVHRATRWGLARTTTVIEDPGGVRGRLVGLALDRRRWPAVPAVILVTTLFTLAISGLRAGVPTSAVATSTPTAAMTPSTTVPGPTTAAGAPGTPSVSAEPAASMASSGPPTQAPTEAPSEAPPSAPATPAPATAAPATPAPSATFRTYRVKSGDTMSSIAARFDTTVGAISRLNNISDPSRLSIGQVLLIP